MRKLCLAATILMGLVGQAEAEPFGLRHTRIDFSSANNSTPVLSQIERETIAAQPPPAQSREIDWDPIIEQFMVGAAVGTGVGLVGIFMLWVVMRVRGA